MKIRWRTYVLLKVWLSTFVPFLVGASAVAEMVPLDTSELASHVGGQVWLSKTEVESAAFAHELKADDEHLQDAAATMFAPRLIALHTEVQMVEKRAGITMDIYLQLSIGELRWTDPDGVGPNGRVGYVSLSNINVGG